jgi:hypothetical protein
MKQLLMVAVLSAAALGGCKTAAERQQIQEAEDRTACARMGAAPGTERDFQCKLALETQRRNEAATYGAIQSAQQQAQTQRFANELMFGRRQ